MAHALHRLAGPQKNESDHLINPASPSGMPQRSMHVSTATPDRPKLRAHAQPSLTCDGSEMTTAGQLRVSARFADGEIRDLAVDLQRPSVARLFVGQLPDVVIKTVPYLFTLCSHAQRAAAQAAVNAALGEIPRPPEQEALWLEVLHENLWRLLLDWPVAVGLPPAREAFIAWRALRQDAGCVAQTRDLVEQTLRPLAAACSERLAVATGDVAASTPAPVSRLDAEAWLAYWRGEVVELPPLPVPASVLAAYRARLAEVETAVAALAGRLPFPIVRAGGAGWGVGQTLTARGRLTHAVHVVDGRVARYRVQAPTDGFFADAAALAALLSNRRFVGLDQARQTLDQAILALDPCLPYTLEVHDA